MKGKIVVLIFVVLFSFQCSHYDELMKNGKESSSGDTSSHNFGADCMECHNKNNSEAVSEGGWWNIAGSVAETNTLTPFTDATVEFWSQQDRSGILYFSLPVDGLGNFYTAKIRKYNGTCFPVVVNNATGEYRAMEQAFHSGGCNSCHGKTEAMIEAP